MSKWIIQYTETARRELRKLDKTAARRIVAYMDRRVAVIEDPRLLGKALRGVLGDLWRYRVGEYRIVCQVRDQQLQVLVVRLGNRKDVYR